MGYTTKCFTMGNTTKYSTIGNTSIWSTMGCIIKWSFTTKFSTMELPPISPQWGSSSNFPQWSSNVSQWIHPTNIQRGFALGTQAETTKMPRVIEEAPLSTSANVQGESHQNSVSRIILQQGKYHGHVEHEDYSTFEKTSEDLI